MPVITRLKTANRRGTRTVVELDGHPWGEVETEVVVRRCLAKGNELNVGQLADLLRENTFIQARHIAAGLLQARPRSTRELRRRLLQYRPKPPRKRPPRSEKQRAGLSSHAIERPLLAGRLSAEGFDEGTVDAVVNHFLQLGMLDDTDFAARYVRHNMKLRAIGPAKLRARLQDLGLAEDIIDQTFEEQQVDDKEGQIARASRLVERRMRNGRSEDPRRRRTQLFGMLSRAGFDGDVVSHLVNEALVSEKEPGDAEE